MSETLLSVPLFLTPSFDIDYKVNRQGLFAPVPAQCLLY